MVVVVLVLVEDLPPVTWLQACQDAEKMAERWQNEVRRCQVAYRCCRLWLDILVSPTWASLVGVLGRRARVTPGFQLERGFARPGF